jgi:putative addiction module component (TIGR02574 family)
MSTPTDIANLRTLPVAERLRLIEELWDSISQSEAPPLQDWHRQELDRRLDALDSGASIGEPWTKVRQRIVEQG